MNQYIFFKYPVPKPAPDLSLEKISYEFADGNNDNLIYKVVNDINLARFLEVQSQIEVYEKQGVFEKLRKKEDEFEAVEKLKRQAEINHRVLEDQTKKEKQDYENISSPNAQSYFSNKESHDKAILKEKVRFKFLKSFFYPILQLIFIKLSKSMKKV